MRAHEFKDQGAAGIVLLAADTGRYGLQQRSNTINDPGLWAAWGGGREPGETLEQCARRELGEESGYTGPVQLKRLGENSKYVTFIGVVPHEFEPTPNDEWQDFCWVEAGDWPSPLHPGTAAALKNIRTGLKEGVLPGFDVFMANIKVKQPSGSVQTQVAVFAKSAQMARMLLQAQYGDNAVISSISKIG